MSDRIKRLGSRGDDPVEDPESGQAEMCGDFLCSVAEGTIRLRILKATLQALTRNSVRAVAEGAIRCRILKECMERLIEPQRVVAEGAIRCRILKDTISSSVSVTTIEGNRGTDPAQDPESPA